MIAPEMETHLQGDLDRGRTVVGVETARESGRGYLHQTFGQLDYRFVCKSGKQSLLKFVQLAFDSSADFRMGMTKDIYPPGTDGIDVAVAFQILDPHALAPAPG